MAILDQKAIRQIGFKKTGKNIHISDKASFYNAGNISIDDHARIDDFCVISAGEGGIFIGKYVHIAVFVSLIGGGKITLSDFSGLSSRTSIFSSNADYSGKFLTNPTVADEFTRVTHSDVHLGRHVVIGSGSVILPGITLEEGAVVGSLSLVKDNCKSFGIYAGIPAKYIKQRSNNLLELEKEFLGRS